MKPKILVTRRLPGQVLRRLRNECEVDLDRKDRKLSKEELQDRLQGKEGMLCLLTDMIDEEVINAGPNLKIIANCAVGFNNIDVEAATARGIMVTNTPGILTNTTADLAWALILATARRIAEADKFTRAGKFKEWKLDMLLGGDVYGKTIGIIGLGRIGQAVAKRAFGFSMRVLYSDVEPNTDFENRFITYNIQYREKLDDLLRESDFVTIHVPLTKETHHLIGKRELNLMKKTAYLINTSRGPAVDEKALVKALGEKRIAGAGLDVYENEPALASGLAELDNAVLLPHIGSASKETRMKMATMAAENLLAGLRGERPPNIVNDEVLGEVRHEKL